MKREDYAFVAMVLRRAWHRADNETRNMIEDAHERIEAVTGQACDWNEYPWSELYGKPIP